MRDTLSGQKLFSTVPHFEARVPRRLSQGRVTDGQGLLSIGALSTATGIPVDTIRTWERRYGFPVPQRKLSGHRVYPLSTVARLRRVAQAIAGGHHAAEVLSASESALESLMASLPPRGARVPSPPTTSRSVTPASGDPGDLVSAIRDFDAERVKRAFQLDWARLGPLEFLERRAGPFLSHLGSAWAHGSLEIRHEHFGSAVLGDFLRAVRLPLDDRATGPVAALATLPGELHGMGLQMSAVVFALAGWRPLILGVDTPIVQIAALVRETPIAAVALSCVRPGEVSEPVRSLRRRLPRHIALLVGGAGAPVTSNQSGIEIMATLTALDGWLHARPAA